MTENYTRATSIELESYQRFEPVESIESLQSDATYIQPIEAKLAKPQSI